MPSGLIRSEGKTPIYNKREIASNVINGQRRRGLNEARDKDSPSTKCQKPSRWADDLVEVRATSCPYDGKFSLKVDESQVGQRH